MKTIFATFIAAVFGATTLFAQATNSEGYPVTGSTSSQQRMEGFFKQGPRVILIRQGNSIFLDEPILVPGGVRIDPDGTVTQADKTQIKLKENQMVTLAGQVVALPNGVTLPTAPKTSNNQATKTSGEKTAPPIAAGEGAAAK